MSDYDAEPLPEPEPVVSEVEANEVEEEPAPVEEEEPAPVEEDEPAPVEEEEPAPVEEEEPAPVEEEESVSTQEVVQNVQEILTTEPAVSSDSARLEERVKVLEERLEELLFNLRRKNICV